MKIDNTYNNSSDLNNSIKPEHKLSSNTISFFKDFIRAFDTSNQDFLQLVIKDWDNKTNLKLPEEINDFFKTLSETQSNSQIKFIKEQGIFDYITTIIEDYDNNTESKKTEL